MGMNKKMTIGVERMKTLQVEFRNGEPVRVYEYIDICTYPDQKTLRHIKIDEDRRGVANDMEEMGEKWRDEKC
jgi:hypothetical protein